MRPLTQRQRKFADAYAGPGSGVEAARAAGYAGAPSALSVQASKLLRHESVRHRITERLGPQAFEAPAAIVPVPRVEIGPPLAKGRGRGTPTERIELLMSIGRDKRIEAKDRINAILAAAELEGERRPVRSRLLAPAPITAPLPPPAPGRVRSLALILSERDRELERD